ncbi:magnesium transporter CorA family protein [Ancylobacter sonchi]|uniref:magnesium transporter CorA family protein n=1 Tax=Ancylobacter sonchi TaxID=1937790 RepID=UPI001BD2ED6A|nr:magnesium transporter CorA family protein [Ancylobacter sonchi]MBS7534965.1 magnesium transporter CorA family protein [Ancylobacter sonchi]
MIHAYCPREGALRRIDVPVAGDGPEGAAPGSAMPADALWIDLYNPSAAEDRFVEAALGIAIPTHEEMAEIEPSSRLRVENEAQYMTGSLVLGSEGERPILSEVSFILFRGRLLTVRYGEFKAFSLVIAKLERGCADGLRGEQIFMSLLDAIVDRTADTIERVAADIDLISRRIFERDNGRDSQRYRAILRQTGRKGDLASKARESLVSMARIVTFLAAESEGRRPAKDQRTALKSLQRDIASLTNHVSYLGDKITFLLDATLGMVSIEQNNIIKIFAVLSVVFMPPTLIASIYGMNFQYMPELADHWGYPLALVAMLAAAIGPYLFFKWKRWL